MDYYEALSLLEKDKSDEILKKCQSHFEDITELRKQIFVDVYHDSELCKEVMDKLAGIKMYLFPIYKACDTFKQFKQEQYYYDKKVEANKNKDKFTSAPIEREASFKVSDYRRLRNGIHSAVIQCETGISACQSTLKNFVKEYNENR